MLMPVSFFLYVHLFSLFFISLFKNTRLVFLCWKNVAIENVESNNDRYALPISKNFCLSFISLALSLSGHIYLTFLSLSLLYIHVFVNFWASQLFAPSVIDDIPLSIRIVITLRLLPLPLPGINVKVVKLKPVQPVKNISCVSYCTRSKSHWVGQRLGTNPSL